MWFGKERSHMSDFEVLHQRARAFYTNFERKADLQHQTHYCPGCGHGITQKLIAKALDELGLQDRTVMVSPVGCSVFVYYYFDTGNVQVAHGRAPAAATGLKRALPESIVISYQGDGDLAAIGSAEILHAANRGEPITVFFLNNAIYGMTGGQMAPTTLVGGKTTTSPFGRSVWNEGYPLHVSEVLASLEAPVYIERVALGNNKMIQGAAKAVKKAIETQVKGLGFSLIEVLSPCPTIWKMEPQDAQKWVEQELTKVYPLDVFRDKTKEAQPRPALSPAPSLVNVHNLITASKTARDLSARDSLPSRDREGAVDLRIKVAGFGGQGVLMLGQVLAEAGLEAGLEVSWLPSYGPEMRSGTSNCHVRIASRDIDSPLISKPNVLMAMNQPSLHKFLDTVERGGCVLYNAATLPENGFRKDVNYIVRPFTEIADKLGDARAGNIVMLGALLEATGLLDEARIDSALQRLVKSERWLELDRRALKAGRSEVNHESHSLVQ
jgi:2-oxoisovalerate ferredoxin oxidoreductase beta subunit